MWNGIELYEIVVEFTTLPVVIGMKSGFNLNRNGIGISLN